MVERIFGGISNDVSNSFGELCVDLAQFCDGEVWEIGWDRNGFGGVKMMMNL